MNGVLLLCGVVALSLVPVHVVWGGRGCLTPMRRAAFDAVARETMHVCWHAVTVLLLFGGAALVWAALSEHPAASGVGGFVSLLHLAFAALFLVIGQRSGIPQAARRLGQWAVFLPLGVVGLLASL